MAYVIRRDREELKSPHANLFVHAGMVPIKRDVGRQHPLMRALELRGRCSTIVDATLGLAGDALHASLVLGVRVQGFEASPVIFSLLEDGLSRLGRESDEIGEAATRIEIGLGGSCAGLAAMPAASADVVMVDPMFDTPRPAMPGFDLLREVAYGEPDEAEAIVQAARRVAVSHVVLKYPKRSSYPACDACVDGKAVRYLVFDAR